MTDSCFAAKLLDLFKFEVDGSAVKKGEFKMRDKNTHLEVFLYDGKKGDRIVHLKDEHDFIRLLGQVKMFMSNYEDKHNPFFGCKSREEICIRLDLMGGISEL